MLVDAGVRVGGSREDRLPDLASLEGLDLAAVLVTHAHADHIGALPLVHRMFPHVPIYASTATARLMDVMLADATRVMSRRAAEELEVPLYDEALVGSCLGRLRPLPLQGELRVAALELPELPDVTVHVSRAGHIAGAVMYGFEARDGRLIISGDVSVAPQRTIGRAMTPAMRYPDLLVLESTYGAREHPDRKLEEERLARAVGEGVEQGHVLIPAFALGRAQELILILRQAQRDGLVGEFPIYVDGLVRTVCAAYAAMPEALSPPLARRILDGGRPFFGGSVLPVETPEQRDAILSGPPCCIIASSGMLTGGPSAYYASRLAGDPRNSIFVTGYQDEEAPGRRLLDLSEGGAGVLELEHRSVPVRCRVAKYALSAHADGTELAGIVSMLGPRAVALVHGDPEARATLAARLVGTASVHCPEDGERLEVVPDRRGGRRVRAPGGVDAASAWGAALPEGIGGGEELDSEGLERVWSAVRDGSGTATMGVRELARVWYGADAGEGELARVEDLLGGDQGFFALLPGVRGLYRALAPHETRREALKRATHERETERRIIVRPDQARILAIVDRHLAGAEDLYRRSVDPITGEVTLGFLFPDAARVRHKEAIERLAAEARVGVRLREGVHQGALAQEAVSGLPAGLRTLRSPSLLLDRKIVRLAVEGEAEPDALERARAAFRERTCWELEVQGVGNPCFETAGDGASAPAGRLPESEALALARRAFGAETGCYKVGMDPASSSLLLRFRFPDAARREYARELERLRRNTGWPVKVHPVPHQEALQEEALRNVRGAGFEPTGTPSVHIKEREVRVRLEGKVDRAAFDEAAARFSEATGWTLAVKR